MNPKGVMGSEYASGRTTRYELIYRYKFRAYTAFKAAEYSMINGKLIDFGAADGLTLLEIQKLAQLKESIGIEYSDELVAEANKNKINVIKGDIQNLPSEIPESHYDVVTALAVLEHLKSPQLCLKEALRVLKPGGLFIASSPNPMWDDIASKVGIHKEKSHHIYDITPAFFEILVKEAGFEFIKSEPFMLVTPAFLPYLKITPNIKLAYTLDKIVKSKFTKICYVNQLFIARKPYN